MVNEWQEVGRTKGMGRGEPNVPRPLFADLYISPGANLEVSFPANTGCGNFCHRPNVRTLPLPDLSAITICRSLSRRHRKCVALDVANDSKILLGCGDTSHTPSALLARPYTLLNKVIFQDTPVMTAAHLPFERHPISLLPLFLVVSSPYLPHAERMLMSC